MAVGQAPERAIYACDPARSRGRRVPEPPSPSRSMFRRDCDRVIHSTAFRRLKHKTQVFVFHEGDHYRTRLTHSLEVAQVARALCRALGADEDLGETLALAHDLGHPPFGHAGERALDACLTQWGGFDHNAQTLSIVTRLEHRYPDFDGLNLTWETLEGIVKHNGPLLGSGAPAGAVPQAIAAFNTDFDLDLASFAGLEAQAAALADDIAYNSHDIDDGLRAGLFALDELAELPLVGDLLRDIDKLFAGLDADRKAAQLVRLLITALIEDVLGETGRRLAAAAPGSADEVRAQARPLVAFSPPFEAAMQALRRFLFARMYRHQRVMRVMAEAEQLVGDLFAKYLAAPGALPPDWRLSARSEEGEMAHRIGDFIAGMTDRFALDEHRRLFDTSPDLR